MTLELKEYLFALPEEEYLISTTAALINVLSRHFDSVEEINDWRSTVKRQMRIGILNYDGVTTGALVEEVDDKTYPGAGDYLFREVLRSTG